MGHRKKKDLADVAAASAPVAPKEEVEKVECPPELGDVARQEWERVAPHLVAAGRLTPLDRSTLAVYCASYALWLEAIMALQSYGTMMKSPNGYPIQSPYVSIATKHAEIMSRTASEFGFTPASRRRLPSNTSSDPLLDLMPWHFEPLKKLE
jgi:P27 family predicted phage terminase small subunit